MHQDNFYSSGGETVHRQSSQIQMQQHSLFTPELIAPRSGMIGVPVDDKNTYQTEKSVAEYMVRLAHRWDWLKAGAETWVEPTAGLGSIARFMPKESFAIEINPDLFACLEQNAPNCNALLGDFFDFADRFSVSTIVSNPPYSNGAAIPFIETFGKILPSQGIVILHLDYNSYCTHRFHEALMNGGLKVLQLSPLVGRERFIHPQTGEPMPSGEGALHNAMIYVLRKSQQELEPIVRPVFMDAGTIARIQPKPPVPVLPEFDPIAEHGCDGCQWRDSFAKEPLCLHDDSPDGYCPPGGCPRKTTKE
jgi:hypothetical protein